MIYWIGWILCGLYAGTVAYLLSDIRKYKRVTITEAATIGFALIGGWITAGMATFALLIAGGAWLSENGDNVLFRLKEKPKETPLVDGGTYRVKDGLLVNMDPDD